MFTHKCRLARFNRGGRYTVHWSHWTPEANYTIVPVTSVIYEEIYFTVAFICLLWCPVCFVGGIYFVSNMWGHRLPLPKIFTLKKWTHRAGQKRSFQAHRSGFLWGQCQAIITPHWWMNTHVCRLSYLNHFRPNTGMKMGRLQQLAALRRRFRFKLLCLLLLLWCSLPAIGCPVGRRPALTPPVSF